MLSASRIVRIGETPHAHERAGLKFIEETLPNSDSFSVWELFEFLDPAGGRLLEVDALVFGYSALYLVEIKSGPGKYEGNITDWYRTPPGEPSRYMTPPLGFANTKAKILKSRLEARLPGQRLPRIEALVFLSAEDIELRFEQYGDLGVVTRKTFARAIQFHQFPGARSDWEARKIAAPLVRDIAATLRDKLGIRPRKGKLHVNEWELGPVLHDTNVYQDREALHRERHDWKARARVYLVPMQTTVEHRQQVRRAADREASLLYELRDHPHILRTTGYATDAEVGPTVLFDHFEGEPLHAFLRKHPDLSFDDRIEIIAQVGRALSYCHQKHIAHGAVSPFSVLVRRDPEKGVQTKLYNFQLGRHDGAQSTSHLTVFVEPPWRVYQAPELDEEGQNDDEQARSRRGPGADVFGLGALAYFMLTGQHPAGTRAELLERLKRDQELDPRTVNDGVPVRVATAVTLATAASVVNRYDDPGEWVNLLLEEATAPASTEPELELCPPQEARPGDRVAEDLEVDRVLGQGATSRVLKVKRSSDGREFALKCSFSEEHDQRLAAEGRVLASLVHQNIVQHFETLSLGGRTCLLLALAGSETLHAALARDGLVSLDYASRYGEELLSALEKLEDEGVLHRDIKPANLGVGAAGKDKRHLTLFDFSLSTASSTDIEVGTGAYREPFLRERGKWDAAADRWSAAVTLHELLTGARPSFPEGKTALDADAEIQVLAERFDPSVRTRLAEYFRRAFERSPAQRFPSAHDMRLAWLRCFDEEQAKPKPTQRSDEPEQPTLSLASITPETLVAALPLSSRARNALDRAGILHAGGILTLPGNALSAIRGVGSGVAKEIVRFRDAWRAELKVQPAPVAPFFPDFRGPDLLVRTARLPAALTGALDDAGLRTLARVAAAPASQVEAIAERAGASAAVLRDCLSAAQTQTGSGERPATLAAWLQSFLPEKPERARYFELLFGLALPFEGRIDARGSDVAKVLKVTPARVYQLIDAAREDWARHGTKNDLCALAHHTVESLGGVASLDEAARAFAERVFPDTGNQDARARARAAALLRIATEIERSDPQGLRLERLSNDAPWLTFGTGHRSVLEALGALADELAATPVLASPGEAQRRLAEIAVGSSSFERLPVDRLTQIAAQASRRAACSSRLELYPRGMDAERALTLASSVLASDMTSEQIRRLVSARYPDAEPLPPRPALDALLARFELFYSESDRAYRRSSERHSTQSTSFERPEPRLATALPAQTRAMDGAAIAARELDEQLDHALDRSLFRVLGVGVADAHETALELVARKRLRHVRLDEALIRAMQAIAVEKSIPSPLIHETDRDGRASKGWNNLTKLARLAAARVAQELLPATEAPLLLTHAGLVARYELDAFLQALVQSAAHRDAKAVFLLVPSHERAGVPRIEGELPIPGALPSQVLWLTRDWLKNRHNAAA